MHKTLVLSLVIAFLAITVVPAQSFAHGVGPDDYKVDLIAGGGNVAGARDVGDVIISNDDNNLYVKFVIMKPGWYITQTQVEVNIDYVNIPQANGNPIPGQFTYKKTLDYATEYEEMIPISWPDGTKVYIAAHADVVKPGGLSIFNVAPLPATATMSVTYPYPGAPSYFGVSITNGDSLNGNYNGWCVDTDSVIYPYPTEYPVNVYLSTGTIPPGVFEHPENFGKVNWIINQNFVGMNSPGGFGVYTYGDVQRAIWTLIDDQVSTAGVGSYDDNRVNEILTAASAQAAFVPGPGKKVAIILVPITTGPCTFQPVIIEFGLPCGGDETAWASEGPEPYNGKMVFGHPFPGKNWAAYVDYTIV